MERQSTSTVSGSSTVSGRRSGGFLPSQTASAASESSHVSGRSGPSRMQRKAMAEAEWVPPDGGWGWFCVFSCFISFALSVGMGRVFGTIYNDVREAFPDAKHMQIAMIPSVVNALTVGLGIVAGALTIAFSCKSVAFVGGLFSGTGFCLSYFSMNVTYMMCTFFLSGIGSGLACTPGLLVVSKCFKRHRVTAVGFSLAGTAVGSMLLPPFLRYLTDEYGFRGALLIQGGITYHICAGALLYREPQAKAEKKRRESISRPPIKVTASTYVHWASAMTHVPQSETNGEGVKSVDQFSVVDREMRARKVKTSASPSPKLRKGFVEKMEGRYSLEPGPEPNRFFTWTENHLFVDLTLFHNKVFVVFFFCALFLAACYPHSLYFIPPYAVDLEFSPQNAVLLISVSASGDLIGRLVSGWVFDRQYIPKDIGYMICSSVVSLSVIGCVLFPNYIWLCICVWLHGWAAGSCFILIPVLLSEYHGTVKLASSFGIVRTGQGIISLITPAIAGYLKDVTGSFGPSLVMLGTTGIFASIGMCLLMSVKSNYRRRMGENWPRPIEH